MGPVATIQKSVLRAIREEVRPRKPASRARDRQGSMDTALGFYFLWGKGTDNPAYWVLEKGEGHAPRLPDSQVL